MKGKGKKKAPTKSPSSSKPNSEDSESGRSPGGSPAGKKRKHRQIRKDRRRSVADLPVRSGPTYTFKDATTEYAAVPQKLEIHPTKTAPSLYELENKLARQKEHEKLKFFSIPIKMYDSDEGGQVDLTKVPFTEEDRIELDRYGSRVVMSEDGRVAAIEVQHEVMNQFKKRRAHTEMCQCIEKQYEVSDKLKNDQKVRRHFMAKILSLEVLLRMPSLLMLYYQKEYAQLHDFIYQQNLLIFFMIAIVQGTRLAGIYFSEVGRYEPCRTIITILTMAGYCMISVLMTALLQQYSIYYIEFQLYEDPVSLETLQAKRAKTSGKRVSYPYVVALMVMYLLVINLILALFLMVCTKKLFNELGNGFMLIIMIVALMLATCTFYLIIVVKIPFFTKTPIGWDSTQILFAFLMTIKWSMWRFYMLQCVVKGQVMKVSEELSQFVSLNFAI